MSIFNINIAVLGNVSSGKSTLLNSLFLEEFTSMNICRNTMVPQIYRELNNNKRKEVKDAKEINKIVSELNDELKLKMDNPEYIFKNDMKEMEFYIHKLKELNICQKNIHMSFYDIPGLNDSKNHELYYCYVKENFVDFDIILYLIDLKTGLNSKDEIDLLNFICKNSSKHDKYVVPIINKSDDMTMEDDKLVCDSKYADNYNNIIKMLNESTSKYYNVKFAEPVLYSAQESYMYRMLSKNSDWELNEELRNMIGVNDMGKKYFTLTHDERIVKVKEIVKNEKFIETMIKMCGYSYLFESLKNIISFENQYCICKKKIINKYNILTNTQISKNNIFDIYNKFDSIYEESIKLQEIFNAKQNILDPDEIFKSLFITMMSNNDNTNLNSIIELKNCVEILEKSKFDVYLKNEISNSKNRIKILLEVFFDKHYDKKFTIEDLLFILEKFKSYEITSIMMNNYADNYISLMIKNNIDFYKDFEPENFKSIISFDTKYKEEIEQLKNYVNIEIIKKISKYIVKNKISSLISYIKKEEYYPYCENDDADAEYEVQSEIKYNIKCNKSQCMVGLYNLMLFYNFYSNKDIEYSEIYTLLLSNYIKILNSKEMVDFKMDKNDDLLVFDNEYVNI